MLIVEIMLSLFVDRIISSLFILNYRESEYKSYLTVKNLNVAELSNVDSSFTNVL